MKILLIYPEFPDTFWSFKHALRFVGRRVSNPPLGLLTVAALLPPSFELRLVDLNARPLRAVDLAWADYAFISAMGVQQVSARDVIARCVAAGIPVVGGGPLFSADPDSFPDVDHLVLGEAEVTLPPFIADLLDGRPRRRYRSTERACLEESPVPRWDLLEFGAYATMSVQYSRGCPHDCEFCNVTSLFGRAPRTKSGTQMVRELDALHAAGWTGPVFFVDDNLTGNRTRAKGDLLPALARWHRAHPSMEFNTQVCIDLADDPELVAGLVGAGFDTVFIGLETPNERALLETNKRQNLRRDLLADVHRLQRWGLQVQGGFILGFDGDDARTFSEMVDFVQRSGVVTAMVGLLQALPGTRLQARMRREGRLLDAGTGDNVDGQTNIVPRMGLATLREGYRRVLTELYSPRVYYARVRTFLSEFCKGMGPPPPRGLPRLRQLRALLASTVILGVFGEERVEYWKLMVWTLVFRPRTFPLGVRLAIMGYHFRRTCQLHIG
ncbi:MAG: B12-binding domain-containing radical SAM protein [Polyangiaceae bacterium]|nr:B12-binding domain-containing radical SAM protein [Polyangiaceae bacterium]